MNKPSSDSIKAAEKNFRVVRHSSYRGGVSEKVEWRVCEILPNDMWRLIREYSTKRDAVHFMYIMAGV
jgi:hypothetical protein